MGKTKPIHRDPSVVQTPLKTILQWAELRSLGWRRNPLLAAKDAPSISISRHFCTESKQAAPHDKSPANCDIGLVSRAVWSEGVQPAVPTR